MNDDGGTFGGGPSGGRGSVGLRILVIDDSPSARKLMQELLLRLGTTLPDLRLSSTIPEALQMFTQWRPDVVFVDLELRRPTDAPAASANAAPVPNLPKDGAELAVKFLEREPHVKIVLCSASEPTGTAVAELVRSGKMRAIVKPVVAAKVREALEGFASAPETPPRRR
jgi:CheY-like chemotaxis protein